MVFHPIPLHNGLCRCVILQEIRDPGVLRQMEKALKQSKMLEKLSITSFILCEDVNFPIPKDFCYHILLGARQNTSLSDLSLCFASWTWDCPNDGRLAYVSHILCDSVGCSV